MHGRFEEITFQADEPELHSTEGAPNILSHSDCLGYQEIWGQHESRDLIPVDLEEAIQMKNMKKLINQSQQRMRIILSSLYSDLSDIMNSFQGSTNGDLFKSLGHEKLYGPNLHNDVNNSRPNLDTRRARNCVAMKESPRTSDMVTAKSFYSRSLLPHSLHRTTSLPVDAVDV
ncbi:hypothetical protein GH714_002792 [Hevea brasiliensis]|uniref:Uncharacterized protein n=1 Tax=Hevea brasiliensis TaxID=3981 RepID=A0A6A6KFX4_HEVBR|nr:hypothetical protein GH714_002792 [Hevea brasiliensis]